MLESQLDIKKRVLRMSFKLVFILGFIAMILVFFLFVFEARSLGTPGVSISEETLRLVRTPKTIMIMAYNVGIGLAISAAMRIARNSIDLFKKSPFEKLSVLLCFEITRILASNALKSFSKRKQ